MALTDDQETALRQAVVVVVRCLIRNNLMSPAETLAIKNLLLQSGVVPPKTAGGADTFDPNWL